MGILPNPYSGTGKGSRRLKELVRALAQHGFDARVGWSPAERTAIVTEARENPAMCRALVALGGDGTVAALVNEHPSVPVCVLPAGTENLFARHFGWTTSISRLLDSLLAGQTRRVDIGKAGGREFCLMAGFGFDADVVTRHHEARLNGAGSPRTTNRAAYVEPILRSSFCYPFPRLTVWIEDPAGQENLSGTSLLVFNLPRYALGLPFAPSARDDDGLLDLVVFRKPGPIHALRYLWLVLRGLHLSRRGVSYRQVRRISIEATGVVPAQLDGDPAGVLEPGREHAWSVEVVPLALEVLVPRTRARLTDEA